MDEMVKRYLLDRMAPRERVGLDDYQENLKTKEEEYKRMNSRNNTMAGIDRIISGLGGTESNQSYWQGLNRQNQIDLQDFRDSYKDKQEAERDRARSAFSLEDKDPNSAKSKALRDAYRASAQKKKKKINNFDSLSAEDIRENLAKPIELAQRANERAAERAQKAEEKANKKTKMSGTQAQAVGFGKRLEQAEQVFSDLRNEGYNRAEISSGLGSMLPNIMQSEEAQRQAQAERNFVNAVLRRESGAAIAESEFESAEKQYFPRAGDEPEVIAQKRRNRQQALESLKAEAGEGWDKARLIGRDNGQQSATQMVTISNGQETLQIPKEDLEDAKQDGFKVVE